MRSTWGPTELDSLVPDYFKAAAGLSTYLRQEKWGFSVRSAKRLVSVLHDDPEFEFLGYSVHIGRLTAEPEAFRIWPRALGLAVAELTRSTGVAPRVLAIGGGWPRAREPESCDRCINPTPIEAYAELACAALRDGLGNWRQPDPILEIEPGRYIVGNAAVLLSTVGAVKRDLGMTWVNVDASTNNLMRIDTNGCQYHVLPATRMHARETHRASIVGLTCIDSVLAADIALPRLRRGDPIAILDAGMYAESASTQFNGIPRPATILINGPQVDLIKERETVLDVFAKHRVPERLATRSTSGRTGINAGEPR